MAAGAVGAGPTASWTPNNQERPGMDRDAILKSMLTGVTPALSDDKVKSIGVAMKAFSDKQLGKMEEAGVRIWPFVKGMPPEYEVQKLADLKDPAAYDFQYRTVRISPASLEKGTITNHMRHELAHAWDDVRSGKHPKSLRKLKGDALLKEINLRAKEVLEGKPFESQSSKKLPPSKLSMQELLNDYSKTIDATQDKTLTFAHETTAEKHNRADVMEFYAEGYSVFHGFALDKQSMLFWLAKNFYDYLEDESKTYGLPAPSRAELEKTLDDTRKNWRNFQ
jgi:hypothetical protein